MKPNVWDQLKSITSGELIAALRSDDWIERESGGSAIIFKKQGRIVSIHSHPHKTYYPGQLRDIFRDIGWNEQDLKRLKLIK
jgi:predicted RNA binding protein YcfA (HicA-like mRNA interferase family)